MFALFHAPVLMDRTPVALSTILGDIGDILTSVIGWVGSIVDTITSNPLIFLFVGLGVGLIAIGVVRRLIKL